MLVESLFESTIIPRAVPSQVVPLVLKLTRTCAATLVAFFTAPDASPAAEARKRETREAFLPSRGAAAQRPPSNREEAPAPADEAHKARAKLLGKGLGKGTAESAASTPLGRDASGGEGGDGEATGLAHFQYLRLGQLVVFVSYRGENYLALEDFDSLQVMKSTEKESTGHKRWITPPPLSFCSKVLPPF